MSKNLRLKKMVTLHQFIETSNGYLEKVNEQLVQFSIPDLGVLSSFINIDEFRKVLTEIRNFILKVADELKTIIEQVITAVQLIGTEISQLFIIQKFITLLFTTAGRISSAFTGLAEIMGAESTDVASLTSFMEATQSSNNFLSQIFGGFPSSQQTNAFVTQLESLKTCLTNLPTTWPNSQLQ